jgi:hypothetical protein
VSPVTRELTCSVQIGPLGVVMSAVALKGSRKWHPDQEKLLLECLIRPEYIIQKEAHIMIGGDDGRFEPWRRPARAAERLRRRDSPMGHGYEKNTKIGELVSPRAW